MKILATIPITQIDIDFKTQLMSSRKTSIFKT